jgi:chitin disaccharide deacetylase
MLIINADDWGRSRAETDAALACCEQGRVTSVSAMMFMDDSERAAKIAKSQTVKVGLHLNFTETFSGKDVSARLLKDQKRISRFLRANKFAPVVYHPFLRRQFQDVCSAQLAEFIRLYGAEPSHIDGHQHMHLCANVVFDGLIPADHRVRRNFSFRRGEKGNLNIIYRRFIDSILRRRHQLTDYFFDLARFLTTEQFAPIVTLAGRADVELMTHPARMAEQTFLLSDSFSETLGNVALSRSSELRVA